MKKEKCFDIGMIQSFIDGELTSDLQENVIGHIALCDSCATLLAETEEENTFAFSVLDEELNVLVPTERLRTKVFESINESKEKASIWQKITNGLGFANGFSFNSPSLVAFASVVFFVSALAIGINFYNPMPDGNSVAKVNNQQIQPIEVINTPFVMPVKDSDDIIEETVITAPQVNNRQNQNNFKVMNAGGIKTESKKATPKKSVGNNENTVKRGSGYATSTTPPPPPPSSNLDGEDSYLQTIATLTRTVDMSKDITLRPKERIAYEKDMAMVDNAIKKMKAEVRKNPKNKAAREILRTSYKNKIDLLNSVAEKTELMASIE